MLNTGIEDYLSDESADMSETNRLRLWIASHPLQIQILPISEVAEAAKVSLATVRVYRASLEETSVKEDERSQRLKRKAVSEVVANPNPIKLPVYIIPV